MIVTGCGQGLTEDEIRNEVNQAIAESFTTISSMPATSGGAEALGLPSDQDYFTVSVNLQSEGDAELAREAFSDRGIGGTDLAGFQGVTARRVRRKMLRPSS